MALTPPPSGKRLDRDIVWPFIYMPLLWILLIHVGTRLMWFLGYK